MNRPDLSIIVPCFNEEEALPIFYEETIKVIQTMILNNQINTYEFVFIDDGSVDKTIDVINCLIEKDSNIHYVSFSRNFGKEAALYAGLNKANGKFSAVMDVDLQDPPSLLPEMLKTVTEDGYDCAASRRVTRKNEPVIRSFFARSFYKIMRKLSDVEVVDGARDFRLMTLTYRNAVLSLCEKNRFTKGIFPWVGFKTKWFEYENIQRSAGVTKWSFWKLFKYSIDGIVGFSTKPLTMASFLGIFNMLISVGLIIFLILRKLIYGDPVQGWASTVCIMIFLGGLQLFALGIIGMYMSKIYIEVKQRPIYIIREEK